MIDINEIIKQVSKRTNTDIQIVDEVCKHVFRFTIDVMKDEQDTHEILFSKLFKFKLKKRFEQDKTKPYSPKL